MPKSENKKLGMELAGFDPLEFFTAEQVAKMRSMQTKGATCSHKKAKFGKLLDEYQPANMSKIEIFNDRNKVDYEEFDL